MISKTNCLARFLLVIVVLIMISCGQEKSGWKGTIEEVDGVTLVKNPREGLWDLQENAGASIIKKLQIGMLDGPEEFLFVYISDVAVNSKGDIYIADRELNEIRKFNRDGEHILTWGRKGQGPGEFQSVGVLAVNHNNDLIAFDGMSGRASVFSEGGEHIETTKRLIANSWISPAEIFDTDEGCVIFGVIGDSLKLFHQFNQDWQIVRSYIDYEFVEDKEYEKTFLEMVPGHCWFQADGNLLYANHYYNHRILSYKNGKLTKIFSRKSDIQKPYEVKKFDDVKKAMEVRKDPKYDFGSYGPGFAYLGRSYLTSLGIFQLTNGHIVNFLWTRVSDEIKEFGVEIFDPSGRFLVYSKLGENNYLQICHKDSNDLFYAIDGKEYYKVITFELDY